MAAIDHEPDEGLSIGGNARRRARVEVIASGNDLEPQVSGKLVDWTLLEATPAGTEDAASIGMSATVDRGAQARQFLRLKVWRSE